jgi:hypothetical protein
MLGGLIRLILFRVLGARVMLALAAFGWLRRMLSGRRDAGRRAELSSAPGSSGSGPNASAYQPSQGSSQTVHRDPR